MSEIKLETYLQGGRQNQILQIGDCVHRPLGKWTKLVHRFLQHLRNAGFLFAPEPLGFDATGREIVSFLRGEVSNYPLSKNASSINALLSAARLLRQYHDASQGFLTSITSDDQKCWQLPPREPQQVICHGDFAPYNVVLDGEQAIGIIDFDTCHPGPRSWDIAYALYRWAPLTNPGNNDGFGTIDEQIKRARLFCQAYSVSDAEKIGMVDLIVERLQTLVKFILSQAKAGNNACEVAIQEGHHLLYLTDIEYVSANKLLIKQGLTHKETE